ncbi:hypothetical protein NC652_035607 [Populus alba x Populus x berolinensis]|nr:hypothetical protein NC652_035607 [Populus alba x Populus x berolinensis]
MEISRVKSLVFQGRILRRCRGIGFDEGKSEGCGRAIEVGDAGVPLVTQNRSLFEPPLKVAFGIFDIIEIKRGRTGLSKLLRGFDLYILAILYGYHCLPSRSYCCDVIR